jgi:hypothetical protein
MSTGKAKPGDDDNDNAYDDEARPSASGGGHDDELSTSSSTITTDNTETPSESKLKSCRSFARTRSHRRLVPLLDHKSNHRFFSGLQQQTTTKTRIKTIILSMQRGSSFAHHWF